MKLIRKLRSLLPKIYRWYWPECPTKDQKPEVSNLLPGAGVVLGTRVAACLIAGFYLLAIFAWLMLAVFEILDVTNQSLGLAIAVGTLLFPILVTVPNVVSRRLPPAINWIEGGRR